MRDLTLALALLIVGSCASVDPNVTAARNVCADAYADPALDPIRDRIPMSDDAAAKASMDQLSDQSRPTPVERAALQAYDVANRRCWDAWDKAGASPIVQNARAEISAALAALFSGDTGYGEFNRRRSNAIAAMQAALEEIERARYGYDGSPFSIGLGFGFFHLR